MVVRNVTGVIATSTIPTPYEVLRALSATDDVSLTAAQMQNGLSGGVTTQLNAAEIVFFGSNAEDETFTWTLYGQTKDGFVELIATGTGAWGEIAAGLGADTLFANVLSVTVEKWINTLNVVAGDNVALYISKLVFDCFGYDKIQLMMTKAGSAATIGALVRWI